MSEFTSVIICNFFAENTKVAAAGTHLRLTTLPGHHHRNQGLLTPHRASQLPGHDHTSQGVTTIPSRYHRSQISAEITYFLLFRFSSFSNSTYEYKTLILNHYKRQNFLYLIIWIRILLNNN